jgi:hypothetical protein
MVVNKMKKMIRNNGRYAEFLSERLGITEPFNFIENVFPYYFTACVSAYTLSKGNIYLAEKYKEAFYFIANDPRLSELKEGSKYLIMHELGHFHDIDYKNERVNSYMERVLAMVPENLNPMHHFPESEATRYALEKSENPVESLAGCTAIDAFVNKCSLEESIQTMERHVSLETIINGRHPHKEYEKLREISCFRLGDEVKNKIKELGEHYMNVLDSSLKVTFLGHIEKK